MVIWISESRCGQCVAPSKPSFPPEVALTRASPSTQEGEHTEIDQVGEVKRLARDVEKAGAARHQDQPMTKAERYICAHHLPTPERADFYRCTARVAITALLCVQSDSGTRFTVPHLMRRAVPVLGMSTALPPASGIEATALRSRRPGCCHSRSNAPQTDFHLYERGIEP